MNQDGSKLWLQYTPLGPKAERYAATVRSITVAGDSPTTRAIRDELGMAIPSLLGRAISFEDGVTADGAILIGTPTSSATIRDLNLGDDLATAGSEGFVIRSTRVAGRATTVIASQADVGALYGTFHFLRLLQTAHPIDRLAITERPKVHLRLLNHWDNLDGSIERGYAGRSLWEWDKLPNQLSPRYAAYARVNASIGINGAVLNNVNTDPRILHPDYLHKVAAIAAVFRPYGLRVFLSVNCASPRLVGNLTTNDPLDPGVAAWWRAKADEIYRLIPDFGGFLVKANSEGQPGPQDYDRTHADGANVLADALAPHGGVVMYRAFVYDAHVDPDRVKRAYAEFVPLDGKFRDNVAIQVKNGPLDFMPREPFHPLFGAMRKTPVIAELQVTQEYLGQSKHLVYLGTLWKEFLDADTHRAGANSTVGKVIDNPVAAPASGRPLTGIVGVANTGSDPNWCGHHFSQSNWYAFGRLAWDHETPAEHIAEDWIRTTLTRDPHAIDVIRDMMLSSRETFVNYTMPLGLHHLIGGDHYAPMPENDTAPRADWTATHYHRAAPDGIGFDRTADGSNAVSQYFPPVRDRFNDIKTCPENLLLWFHRVGWDYRLRSGRTLWEELCAHYQEGVRQALGLQAAWKTLATQIDPGRHRAVAERLEIQVADAAAWRDKCLKYFQQFSGRPIVTSG